MVLSLRHHLARFIRALRLVLVHNHSLLVLPSLCWTHVVMHTHGELFLEDAGELALLQITYEYLFLLLVVHLPELPELVLLEDAEGL